MNLIVLSVIILNVTACPTCSVIPTSYPHYSRVSDGNTELPTFYLVDRLVPTEAEEIANVWCITIEALHWGTLNEII